MWQRLQLSDSSGGRHHLYFKLRWPYLSYVAIGSWYWGLPVMTWAFLLPSPLFSHHVFICHCCMSFIFTRSSCSSCTLCVFLFPLALVKFALLPHFHQMVDHSVGECQIVDIINIFVKHNFTLCHNIRFYRTIFIWHMLNFLYPRSKTSSQFCSDDWMRKAFPP